MTRDDSIPRALAVPRPARVGDLWCADCGRQVPSPVAGVAGPFPFRRELHRVLDECPGPEILPAVQP